MRSVCWVEGMKRILFLLTVCGLTGGLLAQTGETAASAGDERLPKPPRDLGFSAYEPIYFSVGLKDEVDAKFQFSFKWRPFGPSDDQWVGKSILSNMYGSFTQTSLWDIGEESAPFRDSSYRPGLMFYRYEVGSFLGARFGLATGFEHESNGKSGADSRSMNIAFFRPTLRWKGDSWQFTFSPRAVVYLEKKNNKDIADYRGYGEIRMAFGLLDGGKEDWQLAATGRLGKKSGRGSLQLDLTYPLEKMGWDMGRANGYLHAQYFNGHGESLLDYDRKLPSQFRLGLMILR